MLNTAMSRNSELILAGYEAWNRDDVDAYLQTLHPEAKLNTSGVWPDFDPVYSGHEGIAEFWRRMREAWEAFDIAVEQIDEERDCFTTAIRFRGKGADSGIEVEMRFAHGLRMRDGLLAEIFSRRTVEEAREALELGQPAARNQQP
jgi:ketosteroid isomerase-like protein